MTDVPVKREDTAMQKHTGRMPCDGKGRGWNDESTSRYLDFRPPASRAARQDNCCFQPPSLLWQRKDTNIRNIQYIPKILVCDLRENV